MQSRGINVFPGYRAEGPKFAVWLLLPVGVLLIAFAVRTAMLSRDGIWYDEAYTAMIVQRSIVEIVTGVARLDMNTPLHYLLLKLWTAAAGSGEYAQRLLSVFAGVATVALVPALVDVGRRRRLLGLALAAFWPVMIDASTELRMYGLAICLSTASLLLMMRAMRLGRARDWTAWAVVSVAAFGSHVLAALFFAAQLPLWLRWWWPRRARGAAPFAATLVGLLALVGIAAFCAVVGKFTARYVAFAAPAAPAVLAGACIVRLPRWAALIAAAAALACSAAGAVFLLTSPVYANTDFRGAVRFLR